MHIIMLFIYIYFFLQILVLHWPGWVLNTVSIIIPGMPYINNKKNIFIEFAFLCISWLYISWFKSGITILIQLFFFSAMSLFLPNVQHLSTSTRKSTTSSSTLRDQPMTSPGSPQSAVLLLWLGTCHRIFHASKFHW